MTEPGRISLALTPTSPPARKGLPQTPRPLPLDTNALGALCCRSVAQEEGNRNGRAGGSRGAEGAKDGRV